jgi:hypothetical protein
MYVEVVARPGAERLQIGCLPGISGQEDRWPSATRIVVVFTTAAEATTALNLARCLAVSNAGIWLVCPVTRTPLGFLRLERFLQFAKKCAVALPAETLHRLRILACPSNVGADPVEDFVSARSVVLMGAALLRLRLEPNLSIG